MPDDSASLLRQYLHDRSQSAFTQLVSQYIDMVYASARRQVGDADLAQDVTQAVSLVLSQKARSVPADRPLSAWLLTTTRYVAANARRAREHRHFHEQRAAQMAREIQQSGRDEHERLDDLSPLLDEGLARLGAGERDALVLKYFEKKSLRQVGEALGISEEAATKRVSRAVERLRVFFQRRGATVTAAALAAILATESAQAAPIGLAATVAGGASTSAATMAKGAIALMTVQKVKAVAMAAFALVLSAAVTYVVVQAFSTRKHPGAATVSPTRLMETAPPAAPQFAVTFSDGVVVEVVGVSEITQTWPQPWWAADGSRVKPPALRCISGAGISAAADQMKRQVVFRTTEAGKDASVAVEPSTTAVTSAMSVSVGDAAYFNIIFAVGRNSETARLTLSRSGESKMVDVVLNAKAAATQPVATGR